MIDTVLLSTFIKIEHPPADWTQQTIKNSLGTKHKWYYNPGDISFTYYPADQKLFIECSLPKQIFHNNYTMLKKDSLYESLEITRGKIQENINKSLPELSAWIVNKIDLCFNFSVGAKVGDYLEYFSKCRLPKKGTPIYFKSETVTWASTTKGIKFYDKEKECNNKSASGVLRYELRLQHQTTFRRLLGYPEPIPGKQKEQKHWWWKKEDRKKAHQVKFGELLKSEIIRNELNQHLEQLFPGNRFKIESNLHLLTTLINNYSVTKAFTMYGMIKFFSESGLNTLEKTIPTRTFQRVKSQLNKLGLNLVQDNNIKSLTIKKGHIEL